MLQNFSQGVEWCVAWRNFLPHWELNKVLEKSKRQRNNINAIYFFYGGVRMVLPLAIRR